MAHDVRWHVRGLGRPCSSQAYVLTLATIAFPRPPAVDCRLSTFDFRPSAFDCIAAFPNFTLKTGLIGPVILARWPWTVYCTLSAPSSVTEDFLKGRGVRLCSKRGYECGEIECQQHRQKGANREFAEDASITERIP